MLKVDIPKDKNKIKQQIAALKSLLPADDKKSKAIHEQAIKDLEKALSE